MAQKILAYPDYLRQPSMKKSFSGEKYDFLSAMRFNFKQRVSNDETREVGEIYLYMPLSAKSPISTDWEQKGKGLLQRGMEHIIKGDAIDAAKAMASAAGDADGKDLATIIGANVGAGNIVGVAVNPHIKVMFRGIGMRTFEYQFKFTPREAQESADIKDIIDRFRQAALPGVSLAEYYLTYPQEIDIAYLQFNDGLDGSDDQRWGYRVIPWMNRFKSCVITQCEVDYTSAGHYVPMRDGFPAETTLTLQFTETSILTRGNVDQGF